MDNKKIRETSMKFFTIIFVLIFSESLFGQNPSPLNISAIKSREYSSIHMPFSNKLITFRLKNISQEPVIIYGESDEDGFDPAFEIVRFNQEKQKWFYNVDDENPPILENVIEGDEAQEYVLKPGKSIKFERAFGYSCFEHRYKLAVYTKSVAIETPNIILFDEFSLKDTSDKCSDIKQNS